MLATYYSLRTRVLLDLLTLHSRLKSIPCPLSISKNTPHLRKDLPLGRTCSSTTVQQKFASAAAQASTMVSASNGGNAQADATAIAQASEWAWGRP
jgi:hypothetical protein